MGDRKGVYTLISAFLLIALAIFVIIGLSLYVSYLALSKARNADSYKDSVSQLGKKELLKQCYGKIIDMSGGYDMACMGNLTSGVVVSAINYTGCDAMNLTLVPPGEHEDIYVYNIPVYEQNRTRVCPGRLLLYD
jgi:hypothetical protein